MKRGEIWSIAGGADYTGKPRPAVIVQDGQFENLSSVLICPFTTNPVEAWLFRPLVEPGEGNGLRGPSRLMVDKIAALPKARFGSRIGVLAEADTQALDQAMLVFLGLAGTRRQAG